jgi:hypothetical protein
VTVTEIVVGLENEPGRLFAVIAALRDADISMLALSVAGPGPSGSARMLVSDPRRARSVLMGLDVPANAVEAIVVDAPSVGPQMLDFLEPLSIEGINISHLQAFPTVTGGTLVALVTDDPTRTVGIVQEHGYVTLDLPSLLERFRGLS